jgi:hypothetical protein
MHVNKFEEQVTFRGVRLWDELRNRLARAAAAAEGIKRLQLRAGQPLAAVRAQPVVLHKILAAGRLVVQNQGSVKRLPVCDQHHIAHEK